MRLLPLLALILAPLAAAKPAPADKLTQRFFDAIGAQDAAAAEALCTTEFVNRKRLSCRALVREAVAGGIAVELDHVQRYLDGGLTVLLARASNGEVALVWLRSKRVKGGWRFVDGGDGKTSPNPEHQVPRAPKGGAVTASFIAAANTDDLAALRNLCGAAMTPDACDQVARQAAEPELGFRLLSRDDAPKGHVATLAVLRGDQVVDEVFAYFAPEPGGVKLQAVDESARHRALVLDGTLPADLDVRALPSDAEAARWASTFVIANDDPRVERARDIPPQIRVLDALDTATVCWEAAPRPLVARLRRTTQGWVLDGVVERSSCDTRLEDYLAE